MPPKKTPPPAATGARWIMFMPTIPAKPPSVRVRIWRRLQAIGAVNIRGAVYVLPNREECVELFEWLGKELSGLGGQASLCEGRFVDPSTDDDIQRRFVEARDADYAAIVTEAKASARKRGAAEQHARLARRLADVIAIDFVDSPGRARAEAAVAALLRRAKPSGPAKLAVMPRPVGATWVTRTGVHVDRIACSWLIRRFIDPAAKLEFVNAKTYVHVPGKLRFDMFDAEFTHVGDRCSFEVLLERMGLADPGLRAIGEIIHDLDLRDGKFERDETAGVRSAIDGICTVARGDEERIAAAAPLLEGLHSFFTVQARRERRHA